MKKYKVQRKFSRIRKIIHQIKSINATFIYLFIETFHLSFYYIFIKSIFIPYSIQFLFSFCSKQFQKKLLLPNHHKSIYCKLCINQQLLYASYEMKCSAKINLEKKHCWVDKWYWATEHLKSTIFSTKSAIRPGNPKNMNIEQVQWTLPKRPCIPTRPITEILFHLTSRVFSL